MDEDGVTLDLQADLWRQMVAVATSDIWDLESIELQETEEERHLREDDEIPL